MPTPIPDFSPIDPSTPPLEAEPDPDPQAAVNPRGRGEKYGPPRVVNRLDSRYDSRVRNICAERYCYRPDCEGGHSWGDERSDFFWCVKPRLSRRQLRELS